jgi:signal transduction histidine kinase
VSNPDNEMGRLATVFNATLARLEESFEQMRRFTADVSHELRTPLTAIRSVGEVGLRSRRDEAGYRAIIGSMLEEGRSTGRSRRSSADVVARGDWCDGAVHRTRGLEELAESVVGDLAVLAEEKSQQVVVEAHGSPRGLGDRLMVRQAIINLVANAIKFAPAGTANHHSRRPTLSPMPRVDVTIAVPGIPARRAVNTIFDRFSAPVPRRPTLQARTRPVDREVCDGNQRAR